jgi:hypothetical protein
MGRIGSAAKLGGCNSMFSITILYIYIINLFKITYSISRELDNNNKKFSNINNEIKVLIIKSLIL